MKLPILALTAVVALTVATNASATGGWYAATSARVHVMPAPNDVVFTGHGDLLGQADVSVGYEAHGWSVFTGISHFSIANYGHDRGFEAPYVGVEYRRYF